uniref:HMT2 n=1 Tax=Arundo donax TaxID=35708 RepID=A0A0A9HLM3_ARUDO
MTSYRSCNKNRMLYGSGLIRMSVQENLTRFTCNLDTLC